MRKEGNEEGGGREKGKSCKLQVRELGKMGKGKGEEGKRKKERGRMGR